MPLVNARALSPMLASPGPAPLGDPRLAYEPKYDGIRALVEVAPGAVRVWSRLGADKTAQFPEIGAALAALVRGPSAPLLLDGEIVALDARGRPASFQRLQGRIHLTDARAIAERARLDPVALVVFDLLREGEEDLRALPLAARRARLERRLARVEAPGLRLGEQSPGDGTELYRRARAEGWEGLLAKRLDSPYRAGERSPAWRTIKLLRRQTCVIGGWTEPRQSRAFFGALLLGVREGDALVSVGHVGTGFSHGELARLAALLRPLEATACPFRARPATNQRPHWVTPRLVAEVDFSEWTADGQLRHPRYVGLRDDVDPASVARETPVADPEAGAPAPVSRGSRGRRRPSRAAPAVAIPTRTADVPALAELIARLEAIEEAGGAGTIDLPEGHRLAVTSLGKVFWPRAGITKGALMRYYAGVSPFLLPALADRPLVMKRMPDGVDGEAFYQQRAPDRPSPGVRVEALPGDRAVPRRLVGGSLATLLYTTQMATISQDPWLSRVQSPAWADTVAFDLDPMPGVPFRQVLDVARFIRDELEGLGVPSWPKTSGADGLHIYVPLPPRTSYDAGRLFSQLVAAIVTERHARLATVERAVRARGRTVYIDCLQNIRGKTLATAYSARATAVASVSTPLTWREVDAGVDPRAFTVFTLPDRLRAVGDLWAGLAASPGVALSAVLEHLRG
jgi:bifunctional non-homologous end joining protein LigD